MAMMLRGCTMAPSRSPFGPSALDALDEIHESPALVLAQRTRLHESDDVAHLAFVLLVVNLEAVAAPHVLAVLGMLHQPLDRHDHRLLHRVAHDASRHELPPAPIR